MPKANPDNVFRYIGEIREIVDGIRMEFPEVHETIARILTDLVIIAHDFTPTNPDIRKIRPYCDQIATFARKIPTQDREKYLTTLKKIPREFSIREESPWAGR